jgi:acetyl esterase/lipase
MNANLKYPDPKRLNARPVKCASFLALLILISHPRLTLSADLAAKEVNVLKDVSYKSSSAGTNYEAERCQLDLYLPSSRTGFPTLVWFHGGGLKAVSKEDEINVQIGRGLAEAGVAMAMANYRLSPKAKYPAYVEDAAAAFAWVQGHVAEHGGDSRRVFVGGHSAGAYLTFMIGLDTRYLRRHGLETSAIAGLIPVSGQTMTHYTVREERGLEKDTIVADEAAPVHYLRKDAPPMLVLYAEHDMPARARKINTWLRRSWPRAIPGCSNR